MAAALTYKHNDSPNVKASFASPEEAILLESARTGDSAAFESLVMPHWDTLVRVAQRILRNREDAEDAVQTAFLDAFRNLKYFEGRSRFSSWLTRIATNAALMRLRVNRRQKETSLDDVATTDAAQARFRLVERRPNPEQEYLSKEGRLLLERGLERLRPRYAEVLHLRGLQELSAREAAGLLEVPVGTVKARLHRARVQLMRYTKSVLTDKRRAPAVKKQRVGALLSQSASA